MHLKTDSTTMVSWVKSIVTNKRRVKTKGAAERLVKWRLGKLGDLIQEFRLKLQLSFVPSEKNKADVLTRVRKTWLRVPERLVEGVVAANYSENLDSSELHDMHHMGVNRTLFLARKVIPNNNREEVRQPGHVINVNQSTLLRVCIKQERFMLVRIGKG